MLINPEIAELLCFPASLAYQLLKVNWHLKMTNHGAGSTVGRAEPLVNSLVLTSC